MAKPPFCPTLATPITTLIATLITTLIPIALASGGCGAPDEAGGSYVVPAGSSQARPSPAACSDVCSLLTSGEVSDAIGRQVGAGTPKGSSSGQEDGAVTSSVCTFAPEQPLPAAGVALLAWCSPEGGADLKALSATLEGAGFGPAEPVSGLGSEAVWASKRAGSIVSGQLEIAVGETFLLSLQITSALDEAHARSASLSLAHAALARTAH